MIRRFRMLRARPRRTEAGTTVFEMVVVTALLSLVVVAAFGAVASMQKNASSTTNRFAATSEAQTMADRLTKDLRAAVTTSVGGAPFTLADANELEFFANLGKVYPSLGNQPGPTKLHAYLTNLGGTNVKLLHEDATAPTGGTVGNYTFGSTATSRIDGKYLDVSVPMFTYYEYDSVDPTKLKKIDPALLPITDVPTLQSIVAVGITVRVRVTPNAPIAQIDTLVHVRNVDYNPN
jgi:hypothetical protein